MSVSRWAYNPSVCDGQPCPGDCDLCSKSDKAVEESGWEAADMEYDIEEIHHDCTVQIWKNSKTGATSIGWWDNGTV